MSGEMDILGDDWRARVRRNHEREAGIPDYGYCRARGDARPEVRMITPRMLAEMRDAIRREAPSPDDLGALPGWPGDWPREYDPAGDPPEDQWTPEERARVLQDEDVERRQQWLR